MCFLFVLNSCVRVGADSISFEFKFMFNSNNTSLAIIARIIVRCLLIGVLFFSFFINLNVPKFFGISLVINKLFG